MTAHCHKLVAKVAREAASELYETLMSSNQLYDLWKAKFPGASALELERRFVLANWGRCIPLARATLARLLTTTIDEGCKASIMEALVLDSSLIRGRAAPAKLLGSVKSA